MTRSLELHREDAPSGTEGFAIPPYGDGRSRPRRIAGPVATAVGSAAALTYVAAVSPHEPGHYPLCPTQALLAIDCPGCGLVRGTHELLNGNVGGALDHNLLLIALLPLALVFWARWARHAWQGRFPGVTRRAMKWRTAALLAGLIAVAVFGVVRNLVPYLGSGVG